MEKRNNCLNSLLTALMISITSIYSVNVIQLEEVQAQQAQQNQQASSGFLPDGRDHYGLQYVDNFNSLLEWVDLMFAYYNRPGRAFDYGVFANGNVINDIRRICGITENANPANGTIEELIQNNAYSSKDALKYILTALHICYGVCEGNVLKILKICLGSDNLVFDDNNNDDNNNDDNNNEVRNKRDSLTVHERQMIVYIHDNFISHISEHWTGAVHITSHTIDRVQKTGFAVCDRAGLGLNNDATNKVIAQKIIDILLTNFADKLEGLRICIIEDRIRITNADTISNIYNSPVTFFINERVPELHIRKLYSITKHTEDDLQDGITINDDNRIVPEGYHLGRSASTQNAITIEKDIAQFCGRAILAEITQSATPRLLEFFFMLSFPTSLVIGGPGAGTGSFYVNN